MPSDVLPLVRHTHGVLACGQSALFVLVDVLQPVMFRDAGFLRQLGDYRFMPLGQYLIDVVRPQVVCNRVRAWLLVHAAPYVDGPVVASAARVAGELFNALSAWDGQLLFTTQWRALGAPALRAMLDELPGGRAIDLS